MTQAATSSATTLTGKLGFAEVTDLLARADALSSAGTLDLSGLQRVDSAGLSFLLELKRRAQKRQQPLQFVGAPASLRQLADFFEVGEILAL